MKFDSNTILNEFKRQFGHLKKYGLKIEGVADLMGNGVISISKPFIFDNRKLPEKFMGLNIRGGTVDTELPVEFQNLDRDREYIWAYQRFEEYVDKHADLIRKTLGKPDMTRDEMLDALCFGDFRRHKEMCVKWENEGTIPKWINKGNS